MCLNCTHTCPAGLPSVPHLGVQYPIWTVCTSKKFVPLGYNFCTPFGLFSLCIRLKQYFSRINKIIDFSWHLRLYYRNSKGRLYWLMNPLKPNVHRKGHCHDWYKQRNKILHAKFDIFSVQDDMKKHRVKRKSFSKDCQTVQKSFSVASSL
jgi:hypothetical protein